MTLITKAPDIEDAEYTELNPDGTKIVPMLDFMVDIETLGVKPNVNPVIQISLTAFDLESQTIGETITFGFNPKEQEALGLVSDPETLAWWATKPESVRKEIANQMYDGVHSIDKLKKINEFITHKAHAGANYDAKAIDKRRIQFWAKPSHFDYMFYAATFRLFKVECLFPYWEITDMRSFCAGRISVFCQDHFQAQNIYKAMQPSRDVESAHDATADNAWQLRWLFSVENKYRAYLAGEIEHA